MVGPGFWIAPRVLAARVCPLSPTNFLLMNAFGFFLRRLAWQFGVRGERKRWNSVTKETQILSEAQDLLGRLAWRDTDKIDDLTGEYWQIKDLDNQQAKMRAQSEQLLGKIEELKEQLDGIEDKYEGAIEELRHGKDTVMQEAEVFTEEMEAIREEDEATKDRFNSLKNKLEVLKRQEGVDLSDEIQKTRTVLNQLKQEHENNVQEVEKLEQQVRKIEERVQGVDGEIAKRREEMKAESSDLVSEIGKLSKQVAEISAKISLLENSKAELSFKVGTYLSNHVGTRDKSVQQVLKGYRPIVGKISSLKKSIQYNQRLARRTRD